MSFSVHALASGSSGNATLFVHRSRTSSTCILVDAGLTARALGVALLRYGITPAMLTAIVLTHEHMDHARSAHPFSRRHGIPLVATDRTLDAVARDRAGATCVALPPGQRARFGSLEVETFSIPHDAADPVGVSVFADGHKVSQITDAGCITPEMRSAIEGAELLILEANHDVYRLRTGPYPDILKRRILSDRGHLSNESAVRLLCEHLRASGPCSFWLAHLSKTNNLPKLALNYARATLKMASAYPFLLDVALRDRPSVSWSPGAVAVQLSLFA